MNHPKSKIVFDAVLRAFMIKNLSAVVKILDRHLSDTDPKDLSLALDALHVEEGNKAIHFVAQNGHEGCLRKMQELRCDMDQPNNKGETPDKILLIHR